MARDQRAGGGHAHEDRALPLADRGRRLLAQCGVGLVADDDRVRVGDLAHVAHEPLVGLDGDGALGVGVLVLVAEQRCAQPLLVAPVGELAVELVHQVAAVGQDQHAAGARGLGEADRGHRLAGAGGVLEPEAAVGARVLVGSRRGRLVPIALLGLAVGVPVQRLVLLADLVVALELELARRQLLDRGGRLGAVAVLLGLSLYLCGQRDQGARQRVDLVRRQRRAVNQMRLLLGQDALESQDQRELAPPQDRGRLEAGIQLGQGGFQRAPAGGARRQRHVGRLALEHERLTRKRFCALQIGTGDRRGLSQGSTFSHEAFWFSKKESGVTAVHGGRDLRWRQRLCPVVSLLVTSE